MSCRGNQVDLRDYVRILRKHWLLIVLSTLIGVGGGAAASILTTPEYEATTRLYVAIQTSESATAGDLAQGSSFAQQKVRSYVEIVSSPRVLSPVIEELGLETTPAQLSQRVTATSPLNTVIIEITTSDTNAERAAAVANFIGASFSDVVVNDLESPLGGGPSLVKIEPFAEAIAATSPSSPRPALNLAIGLLAGVVLGYGFALLRTTLDTRVHGPLDVAHITDRPILGGISTDPEARKRPLIVHVDPRNPRAESFRALRTNLQFVNLDNGSKSLVVTSSVPGEGKSTTTANLAISLAETGARVVIIDGDLRLPKVAEYMGLEGSVGLTDVLIGRTTLADVLQQWGSRGKLFVLPAGRVPPNPSELLGSQAMHRLVMALEKEFDYVLIDAPPLLPVTDAAVLSKITGGAVVISASGRVKRGELQAALRSLENIGSKVVGVVMTMLPIKGPDSYGYGTYGAYYGGSDRPVEEPALAGRRGRR
jgi:capsular exopolysaccharide synthesis family protein